MEVEFKNGLGNNGSSSTRGTKEMFVRRNFDLLENGNFVVKDTVLVRFRLYSDPYANGWGWAIDNLKIQDLVVSNKQVVSPGDLRIYPNPFKESFTIGFESGDRFKDVVVNVFDNTGRLVLQQQEALGSAYLRKDISMSGFDTGVYYVQLVADGKQVLTRKMVKH